MSGLNNREGGKFITIYQGKFCIRVPEGTEGSFSRVNKIGKEVNELFYDSFTGVLKNIKVKDSPDYGKNWEFVFEADGQKYTLQLSYSNSFATALLKMLPNIDVSKEFTLSPSMKLVEGKNQSSLFVNQDGKSIKHAYTKDNPNGLPDMLKIKVKGQDTWDDSDRLIFLTEMINRDILPKLGQEEEYKGTKESDDVEPF